MTTMANIVHMAKDRSGTDLAERVSAAERLLWVDISRPILLSRTAGGGQVCPKAVIEPLEPEPLDRSKSNGLAVHLRKSIEVVINKS